jgi:hydroxyethylthiazole kinase-like uncharacterized protein yjeF
MQRVTSYRPWPLFDLAATRAIEAAATAALPPHTLMQRAGLAAARLAMAIAPHARAIWIACGPGNNGGDGFEAAMHLHSWGKAVTVTWAGDESRAPADARLSLVRTRNAGVRFAAEPPERWDLAIDALLGIGAARPIDGKLAKWAALMNRTAAPVLAVDVPSGLAADTGDGGALHATHTLSLLTLKPGLFTGAGRDFAGEVWFDDLGVLPAQSPSAWLSGPGTAPPRAHASHKGSHGDVAVIGGGAGMTGAGLLAATAALHAGAGRVFAALLDGTITVDPWQPELMFRRWDSLDLAAMSVACGCGGGDAIRAVLPQVLSTAGTLVLDADALNAIASDPGLQTLLSARARRGRVTVLTPHPLEAARLLGSTTADVQADRIEASRELGRRYGCISVLKGSGTIIAQPTGEMAINPTGNARLATAGTGDVLAGLIAARLAIPDSDALAATAGAVYDHGRVADLWPANTALTANTLARALVPPPARA